MKQALKDRIAKTKIFGKADPNKINYVLGEPFSVRNDGRIGAWKIGMDNLIGKDLPMAVIGVQDFQGDVGKTCDEVWTQLFFIPVKHEILPPNTVCSTLIKNESRENFKQCFTLAQVNNDPAFGVFEPVFEKRSNDKGDYYALTWQWRERKGAEEEAQLELLLDFTDTDPLFWDSQLPQTLVPLEPTTVLNPAQQVEILAPAK